MKIVVQKHEFKFVPKHVVKFDFWYLIFDWFDSNVELTNWAMERRMNPANIIEYHIRYLNLMANMNYVWYSNKLQVNK